VKAYRARPRSSWRQDRGVARELAVALLKPLALGGATHEAIQRLLHHQGGGLLAERRRPLLHAAMFRDCIGLGNAVGETDINVAGVEGDRHAGRHGHDLEIKVVEQLCHLVLVQRLIPWLWGIEGDRDAEPLEDLLQLIAQLLIKLRVLGNIHNLQRRRNAPEPIDNDAMVAG
jgi:hypothetical protein